MKSFVLRNGIRIIFLNFEMCELTRNGLFSRRNTFYTKFKVQHQTFRKIIIFHYFTFNGLCNIKKTYTQDKINKEKLIRYFLTVLLFFI